MNKAAAVAAFLLSVLAAGSVQIVHADEGDNVTLDVIICEYSPNTTDWFLGEGMDGTSFVNAFIEENPDIALNLSVVPWAEVTDVVAARIREGNPPDILNLDRFSDYVTAGLLMPVKEYCSDDLYNDFFPEFLEEARINGTVWAVPILASARTLFYNADILKEAGQKVPATWSDLKEVCRKILDHYDGKIYPCGLDMTTDEGQAAFAYYTFGNGGGFVDGDGEWKVNSRENIEALQFMLELVDKNYTNPDPANESRYVLQDLFAEGRLAMLIAPNSLPSYLESKDSTVRFNTAPIPAKNGKTAYSVGVMDYLMAFSDDTAKDQAARKDAIGRFLKFFFAPENYVGWVIQENFLPAVNSAVTPLTAVDSSFAIWLSVLSNCKFYPVGLPGWDEVKQGIINVEQNVLKGADVKEELDALQRALEESGYNR